ncbi:hypothetical protein [uncultured Tateyamaria sp.]|uniref:hypothetical protein n=1 Tax=uncultured Tateyamaria sp. TaxID=455651 RepID=UPI0026108C34|nr:hypothetical protein [uncultured Tateyamaria sp.]
MSFLPHGSPRAVPWYGSFVASLLAHAGIVSFVLFSGVVVLVPTPPEPETPEITVSLEILDAAFVEELEPVDDSNLVPEDAEITAPDDIDAETPDDLAALAPDEDLLAPEEELLEPELEAAEPELLEPEPLEPEVSEPEVVEPEPLEPEISEPEVIDPEPTLPEVAEPEVIEPEPTEPEVAEVLPDPEPEPLPEPEPEVVEPELTEPEPEVVAEAPDLPDPTPLTPLAPEPTSPEIEDLLAIDDAVVNPLGEGGSGVLPPDDVLPLPEDFAALVPEPEAPEAVILEPDPVEESAPIVLPQEPEEAPEEPELPEADPPIDLAEPEPEPEPTPDPEPEPVEEIAEEAAEEAAEPPEPEVPAAPAVQALANPSASDVAIGQLLRRIRATAQEQCTLALPRRAGGDALAGLAMIGADEAVLDAQAQVIVNGLDFAPVQTREILDPRQCASLDALRASDSYPANRIGLSIDTATLLSGDALTGRVLGAGGLFVTLLLVDDNGVVQDLAPFVSLDGNTPVFDAPVARSGPARATRQVLVAIGTSDAPLDLSGRIGQEAQQVFGSIPSETLQSMVFGVATFDVQ